MMGWVTTYDLRVERCPRARSIGMRRTEDAMAQRVDQPPRSRLASLPLFYRVISGQRSFAKYYFWKGEGSLNFVLSRL